MVHAVIYDLDAAWPRCDRERGMLPCVAACSWGSGAQQSFLSAMPPASCPFVSMTRAVSLQWTARCAQTIPRDGLRVVEPLRHQDDGNWIS